MKNILLLFLFLGAGCGLFAQNNLGSGGSNTHNVRIGQPNGNYIQFADSNANNIAQVNFRSPNTTGDMTKFLLKFDPPTTAAGTQQSPYFFGIANTVQSGNSGNNVFMHGWNLSPGGSKVEGGKPAIGESTEHNWRPLSPSVYPRYIEKHEFYIPSYSNLQRRLSSYTIIEDIGGYSNIDFYHTISKFHLKDTLGYDYFSVSGTSNGTRSANLSLSSGAQTGLKIDVDSIQNSFFLTNTSTQTRRQNSILYLQRFNRYIFTNYNDGRTLMDFQGNSGELFFGGTSYNSSYYFQFQNCNSGSGTVVNGDLTSSSYNSRGQFWITNTGRSAGWISGYRSDANFAYTSGYSGTVPYSSSFTKFTFGKTVSGAYPKGSAFFNIYSEQANTIPTLLLSTTTDSIKAFVTAVDPNSVLTGRPGDFAHGTNGKWYGKVTGNNTNSGWGAFLNLVDGLSASTNQVLAWNGSSWAPATNTSESTKIGTFSTATDPKGLTISGDSIKLMSASLTRPGGINLIAQAFQAGAGAKLFQSTGTASIAIDNAADTGEAGINFTQLSGADIMAQMSVNSTDASNARLQLLIEDDGAYVNYLNIGTENDEKGVFQSGGMYEDAPKNVTSTTYTLQYGDRNLLLNATNMVLTLQEIGTGPGQTKPGRVVWFFNDDTTAVTLTGGGGQNIVDANTLSLSGNTGISLIAAPTGKWVIKG